MSHRLVPLLCALLFCFATAEAGERAVRNVDDPHWSSEYDRFFQKYSKRYFGPFFDWRWFKAQAIAESGLKPNARSPQNAIGVMQILPSTFAEIRQANPEFDEIREPKWNIAAGIYYDRMLYRMFDLPSEEDRLMVAFASYNAGYGRIGKAIRRAGANVERWETIAAYSPSETRAYVARIRQLMQRGKSPKRRGASGLLRLFSGDEGE